MQNLSVCPDAKASPFGRGVTAGDGEGKLSATEPPHGDRQPLCQSETIATSAILWQRPCPLRRFAPALPKGEPLQNKKRGAQVVKSVCPAFCSFLHRAPYQSAPRCAQGKRSKP